MNLSDNTITTEELLGPPKVDIVGLLLMTLFGMVVGFIVGMLVFFGAFFIIGGFTMQSGVSPILISMVTFFALFVGNSLYLVGLSYIFPHIYSRSRTLFVQISAFTVALYIMISILYMFSGGMSGLTGNVLPIYALHIILNVFGLTVLMGILSVYRYSILFFYSGLLSFLCMGYMALWVYASLSVSSSALFILIVFAALVFTLGSFVSFGTLAIYGLMYRLSGSDPIGTIFEQVAHDERQFEQDVEKTLLKK